MRITKDLKSQLLSFAFSIVPLLLTNRISDLEAIKQSLQMIISLIEQEQDRNAK